MSKSTLRRLAIQWKGMPVVAARFLGMNFSEEVLERALEVRRAFNANATPSGCITPEPETQPLGRIIKGKGK